MSPNFYKASLLFNFVGQNNVILLKLILECVLWDISLAKHITSSSFLGHACNLWYIFLLLDIIYLSYSNICIYFDRDFSLFRYCLLSFLNEIYENFTKFYRVYFTTLNLGSQSKKVYPMNGYSMLLLLNSYI